MKPKILLLAILSAASLSIASCEKDKSDKVLTPEEVAGKIAGKWQVGSIWVNNNYGGADHKETYAGTAADYVEFRADGKMHTFFQGNLDISTYKVKNDKVITIDDDPASIQELTDTVLRLYSKDETGTYGFTEVMYHLKR